MDPATARQALEVSQGKAITALRLDEDGALSMRRALAQSFCELDRCAGPPQIWSKVSSLMLLEDLLLWVESRSRSAFQDNQPVGPDLLRLHSCLGALYGRVKGGAAPAQDILVAEAYRLCRSRGHPKFDTISEQFLANLE